MAHRLWETSLNKLEDALYWIILRCLGTAQKMDTYFQIFNGFACVTFFLLNTFGNSKMLIFEDFTLFLELLINLFMSSSKHALLFLHMRFQTR